MLHRLARTEEQRTRLDLNHALSALSVVVVVSLFTVRLSTLSYVVLVGPGTIYCALDSLGEHTRVMQRLADGYATLVPPQSDLLSLSLTLV